MPVPLAEASARNEDDDDGGDDDDDDEYAPLRFVGRVDDVEVTAAPARRGASARRRGDRPAASVLGMTIPDEEENAPEERTRWDKSIHAAVMKWWFRNVAIVSEVGNLVRG